MSNGGVFQIIANDGKSDKLLTAQAILSARINALSCARARAGMDTTPSINEIEQSHILFFVAHSKPFATLAFEYNKVRPTTGGASWGSSGIQYSIPIFGDFFIDMVVNVKLDATQATLGTVPAFPEHVGLDNQATLADRRTSGTNNASPGVYIEFVQSYINIRGNTLVPGSAIRNYVRYAELPALRLFKLVKFDVNNSPLDSYGSNTAIFHHKFKILPHQMTGWKRLIGQEVPVDGYTDLLSIAGTTPYSSAVSNLLDVTGSAALGSLVNASTTCRKVVQIVHGPQTPQETQPIQSWWIKLLFWFCDDPRLAVPSIAIPYGQRFITIDLESQSNILFVAPGNLFYRLAISQQRSAGVNAGLIDAQSVTNDNTSVTITPVLASNSVIDTTQKILDMNLFIDNLFVSNEIHDIFIKSIGFTLVRIHLSQSTRVSVNNDRIRLTKLKWPVETIFVGMRPVFNISAANPNQYRDWHRLTLATDNLAESISRSSFSLTINNAIAYNDNTTDEIKTGNSQYTGDRVTYPTYTETIKTLALESHGTKIYNFNDSAFYRDYLPYHFGGNCLVTPEDPGALFITFCLYPGIYQPSGYFNLSRARETDIEYTSDFVSSTTNADLIIEATAINFLVIADGSATLRYTT
jgi:hypothetical protein